MKRFFTALLTAAALLAILPAALAAEEKLTDCKLPEPIVIQREGNLGEIGLLSLENGEWEADWTCYKDQLSGDALTVYQQLEAAFAAGTVVLNGDGCWDAGSVLTSKFEYTDDYASVFNAWWAEVNPLVDLAVDAFVRDNPEYFWVRVASYTSGSLGWDDESDLLKASITLEFLAFPCSDSMEERTELQSQIDEVLDELLSETAELPTLGKLMYMDSWLAEKNHYNNAAAEDPYYISSDETPWSIVGGLLDGYSPVCEGYSKAFQLFCHEVGVPCIQVVSSNHMWTYVQFEGQWYLCDPTWNDPIYVGGTDGDVSNREYFMVSWRNDHQPLAEFILPELAGADLDTACSLGHNYSTVVTNPTCTEGGYTTYTCSVCGDSYVGNYVEETGHSFTEYVNDEALCDHNCGAIDRRISDPSWRVENGVLEYTEYGTGSMMIALYDGNDRLLSVAFCRAEFWKTVDGQDIYRFHAPDMDSDLITRAAKILCFNYDGKYVPLRKELKIR